MFHRLSQNQIQYNQSGVVVYECAVKLMFPKGEGMRVIFLLWCG